MTDERTTSNAIDDSYLNIARNIVGGICQSRIGLGALRELREIMWDSANLALRSSFLMSPQPKDGVWPPWTDPDIWHYMHRHGNGIHHRSFFERLLGTPSNYDPSAFWAIFWALAKAEHDFLIRYVPFWSNEERLTGHLVSQIVERITEFASHWGALGNKGTEEAHCRIWYIDTATARREKFTGADLGLVIQAKLPGQTEYLKAVRLQAKKSTYNGQATIDLEQLETLTQKENLGYYIFYHQFDNKRWSPAPTVRAAGPFKELEDVKKARGSRAVTVRTRDRGWDFATFVTFGVADQATDYGILADSPSDAASILMESAEIPSRVLVLTLGSSTPSTDWNQIFSNYAHIDRLG